MPPHLLDETLPLAGGRQHADRELLPVPPVPPAPLAAAPVIRLVDAVLALRGFMKS